MAVVPQFSNAAIWPRVDRKRGGIGARYGEAMHFTPTPAQLELLAELQTAKMLQAVIAARLGIDQGLQFEIAPAGSAAGPPQKALNPNISLTL
jgi:hypothetical protein